VDVLVVRDHKFLLRAGRGIGYCYLAPSVQPAFTPINAGWRASAVPFVSFFGPDMTLSATASRFDTSISWMAAIGSRAALAVFTHYGSEVIFARNRQLAALLRTALADAGWDPISLPEKNHCTILTVPLSGRHPARFSTGWPTRMWSDRSETRHLRLAIHVYNHEDDIDRLVAPLKDTR
jgi:selenocysteine lyase/cysteine desulfurase